MKPRNIYLYWVGKEYKLISILRNLIYLHSTNGIGYKVNLITDKNISDYIEDLPDYFSKLCPAHQADFVRVNVICDYGGIWLDSDTLVLNSLDSLFDYIESNDGFMIKENNDMLWNGIFGSRPNTPMMIEWKKQMRELLDINRGKIGWCDIGNIMLQNIYNTNCGLYDNFHIFNGLDNLYPVNWDKCVTKFIDNPYDNYKTIVREYQPLIVLVNSVYKKMENKTEKEILDGNGAINYFINKSFENKGISKNYNINILSIDWCKTDGNNFGDMITPYLYTKFKNTESVVSKTSSNILLGAGSILNFLTTSESIVWGSGLGVAELIDAVIQPKHIISVRGLLTYQELEKKGIKCPKLFGDPGLVLSKVYNPYIDKKYKIGIIPHWTEYNIFKNIINDKNIIVINLQDNFEKIIDILLSCENTMSTSLHGIIVSHSYKIPCGWIRLPEYQCNITGGLFKFLDYYSSLEIYNIKPIIIDNKYFSQSSIAELVNNIKSYPSPTEFILNQVIYNILYLCPISSLNEYSRQHISNSLKSVKYSTRFNHNSSVHAIKKVNNNKSVFENIYEKSLWNNGDATVPLSGPGSSLENTKDYSNLLNKFIYDNECKSVLDLGCGDLTWISKTWFFNDNRIKYTGVDVVEKIISSHRTKFPEKHFLCKDITSYRDIDDVDIIIIRDVIFHLTNDEILSIFDNIKNKFKFIIITNCRNSVNKDNFDRWHFSEKNIYNEPFNKSQNVLMKMNEPIFNRDVLIYSHNSFYDVKKYVIYTDWIETYLTKEPFTFVKNLEKIGWKIIKLSNIDIENIKNTRCVVVCVTYDDFDISLIKCDNVQIIYKIDDLYPYKEIRNKCIETADTIISPYQYLFNTDEIIKMYKNINLTNSYYIPYSAVDDFFKDTEFNSSPINKIFVSGSIRDVYPLRVFINNAIFKDYIECLVHPSYATTYTHNCINNIYYKKLNEYLCGFVDASCYNYILLKVFEICSVGSLLLVEETIENELNKLGFFDNVNCIFCNKHNLENKMKWILNVANRQLVDDMSKNGMALVIQRHTTKHRSSAVDIIVNNLYIAKK